MIGEAWYNRVISLSKLLLGVTLVLLVIVNFLAFHDFFEAHTFRDWLMLAGSITFFIYAFGVTYKKVK
jgi:hypothetical protein